MVLAAQLYTAGRALGISVLPTISAEYFTATSLYFALTTAEASGTMTADIIVYGVIIQ